MNNEITVTINGHVCKGTEGQTILDIAEANGIYIANLCHNGELGHYGGCSVCVCEEEGGRRLLRACATKARDGQVVSTETERASRSRKIALELIMSDHTGDCLGPCVHGCPNHVHVQDYIQAIAHGQNRDAVQIIKERLPLPASIGRVCPHPCETECRRQYVEEPVSICFLKAAAADRVIDQGGYVPEPDPATGKTVGIIGGGPAGLTAAYFLALSGHQVTVVDAMPQMGGMLRYGIPEYRLPKATLDAELAEIESLGITYENGVHIGVDEPGKDFRALFEGDGFAKNISFEEFRKGFDATIVATGAWTSSKLRCEGDDLPGVWDGIDLLERVALGQKLDLGDDVVIVGGGNTAMDCCRTAVRLGVKNVSVVYRRTEAEMPAEQVEIDEAREEGVRFRFLRNPNRVIAGPDGRVSEVELQVMELGEPDASGRRRPVPVEGQTETIPVSSMVAAIGQKVSTVGFEGLELTDWRTIVAGKNTYKTNIEGVYACGDNTNDGAGIAIEAIAEGRYCAQVVDAYLGGMDLVLPEPYYSKRNPTAEEVAEGRQKEARAKMPVAPAAERRTNFEPVYLGFTDEVMQKEAQRCLDCGCFDRYECRLLDTIHHDEIHPERFAGEMHEAYKEQSLVCIERDQGKCILCGTCVRMCEEEVGKGFIGLQGRGFPTSIETITVDPDYADFCKSCKKCAEACPTGALKILSEGSTD
ncbi:FAD-dependent oxidoreductase [Curtanaerobium respiraculi]|uniref:FAD-dependent oxidoreductase n=1 Tax=Curtanaerobium respiraculi TaxID=2949669 RepID=UPI0024B36EB3|nr:FAD-dependent oxidoreductase [Curtanaerobium respiraculi]